MRLGRRLLALTLNVLLLHLAWAGSRGECAPAASNAQHHGPAAMAAMHDTHTARARTLAEPTPSHGDCQGEMLGSSCGLMAGCASAALVNGGMIANDSRSISAPRIAGDVTGAPLAVPQPLPPPPRA